MKQVKLLFTYLMSLVLYTNLFSQNQADIIRHLKAAGIEMNARLNQFESSYNNRIKNTTEKAIDKTETGFSTDSSSWQVKLSVDAEDSINKNCSLKIIFRCISGHVHDANVSMNLKVKEWSKDNYVLMPACAYNGNRFQSRRISYSPKLYDMRDIGPNKPMIISDVPRLNINPGPSSISVRSGDLSVPLIGIQKPQQKKGILFYFNPASEFGDNGIRITENRDRTEAEISLAAPVVREGTRYFIADNQYESTDKPVNFKAGDSISFNIRIQFFDAPTVQTLFDRIFEERYEFLGFPELKPTIPFSSCFEVQEKKFNEQNFVPEFGYYSVGMRENYSQDWQIGWTGGMISTYPLLFAGDEKTRANVIRNFDWLFPNGISPSGFFWDAGEKGTIWYGGDQRKYHTKNWHLIRKSCDGIYYIIKQFELMKRIGIPVKKSWEDGTQKVTDALVKLWENNHQFGQFVNSITGEIEVGGSTSAALAPAALALASNYFGNKKYLEVAMASADSMYQQYVSKGITCGGPGDALQNPDSESAYAMLESFILLYEQTKKQIWLQRAKEMAHQFATWVMPYNYKFPENSLFGRFNMQTAGTVWANTQNKHSAPGICTHSGVALLRLYRVTGDERYLKLLQQITQTIPQYLSHPLRLIPGMKEGWMSERINTSDWLEGIGEMMYGSTWAETSLMLTYVEIPGIYIVPDKNLCVAFDNIEANVIRSDAKKIVIEVNNPTNSSAVVKLKVESLSSFDKPLPENYLFNSKLISIKPKEKKIISFPKKDYLNYN